MFNFDLLNTRDHECPRLDAVVYLFAGENGADLMHRPRARLVQLVELLACRRHLPTKALVSPQESRKKYNCDTFSHRTRCCRSSSESTLLSSTASCIMVCAPPLNDRTTVPIAPNMFPQINGVPASWSVVTPTACASCCARCCMAAACALLSSKALSHSSLVSASNTGCCDGCSDGCGTCSGGGGDCDGRGSGCDGGDGGGSCEAPEASCPLRVLLMTGGSVRRGFLAGISEAGHAAVGFK